MITLLKGNKIAHHLPFIRISLEGRAITYNGIKPIVIAGIPWVPLSQTFEKLGQGDATYDEENKRILYSSMGRDWNDSFGRSTSVEQFRARKLGETRGRIKLATIGIGMSLGTRSS